MLDLARGIGGASGVTPGTAISPPLTAAYNESGVIRELRWFLDGNRVAAVENTERVMALIADAGMRTSPRDGKGLPF